MEVEIPNTSKLSNNDKNNNETQTTTSTCARTYLKRLGIERETLENELSGIISELTSGINPIGIDTPFVDNEGYPRSDIDLYHARELRKRYNELSYNLKDVMKKIEGGLHKISATTATIGKENFSSKKDKDDEERKARLAPKPKPKFDPVSGKWVVSSWDGSISGDVSQKEERTFNDIPNNKNNNANNITATTTHGLTPSNSNNPIVQSSSNSSNNISNLSSPSPATLIPFAVLDSVSPSSPASEAGLHEGDLIVKFGTATFSNHKNLSLVAENVSKAANEQESITVTLLRRRPMNSMHDVEAGVRDNVVVDVFPKSWSGRGVLGCHIVLYNEVAEARSIEPC